MTAPAADDLQTVAVAASEFEAEALVVVLAEAEIPAHAFGAARQSLPLGTKHTGVPVQVRHCDADRARATLRQRRAESGELDWEEVDVGARDDDLPLTRPGRMPLLPRLGFIAAMIIAALMAIGLVLVLVAG